MNRMDCCHCLGYLLMVFNFVDMVLGITLVGVSVWAIVDGAQMGQVFADTEGLKYILYSLIVLGALKILVGLLGCCSVAKRNPSMLSTFFALVLMVFLCQLAAGIWMYVDMQKQNLVTSSAAVSLANFVQKDYETAGYEAKSKGLDLLQAELKCCGSNGYVDWSTSVYNGANETSTLEKYMVPPSCCISNDPTFCDEGRVISGNILEPLANTIYKQGCINEIFKVIVAYLHITGGVIGGGMLIELFMMISTMILCRNKDNWYYERQ